ncbi:MAG: type II toxin-antitoxin system HicB family antitoxin [Tunicatimonas sp.]|uniref:type II toxin-antitoxin system HicB family antitoxin n=1 Tax=Tunicatimonas sp. TaxID=1940096 RepID=UPI003C76B299
MNRKDVLKYEIIIYWSTAYQHFIAEVPELSGCMADGATYEDTIDNVQVVMSEWIETAQEKGWDIPEPKGKLMYA